METPIIQQVIIVNKLKKKTSYQLVGGGGELLSYGKFKNTFILQKIL